MKRKAILLMLLLISLCSCRPGIEAPTSISRVTPTPTETPRWMMYETALLRAMMSEGDGLCEWEILGTSADEVYVWVDCKLRGPIGSAMSVPAVIYLRENGEIEKVTIPRDGVNYPIDVGALFPPDIQERIFSHDTLGISDLDHLITRLEKGGPPLIVVLGTPMP